MPDALRSTAVDVLDLADVVITLALFGGLAALTFGLIRKALRR